MRALIVDDNSASAEDLNATLKANLHVPEVVSRGEDGLHIARHYAHDILFLELLLPDIDGFEIIHRLRDSGSKLPIIVVSGLAGVEYKTKALRLGADDYVVKPYHKMELMARMEAVLRRCDRDATMIIAFGRVLLDISTQRVKIDDHLLHLTQSEYTVFELLARKRGQVVNRTAIYEHLYESRNEDVEIKVIDVFVCKLRQKLNAEITNGGNIIETVWGRGYMVRDAAAKEIAA